MALSSGTKRTYATTGHLPAKTPRRLLRLAYDRPPETPTEKVLRIVRERCPELSAAYFALAFAPKLLGSDKSPPAKPGKSTKDARKRVAAG